MKIVMITHFKDDGGVYTHVEKIVVRLTRLKEIDLHIIALGDENSVVEKYGATLHFIKDWNCRLFRYFYYPLLIRKIVLEINPDIIHIHGTGPHHSISAITLIRRYPLIVTIHGLVSEEMNLNRTKKSLKSFIRIKIDAYLEMHFLKKVQYVIAPSPHLREYFNNINKKIMVIPNGVEFEEIKGNIHKDEFIRHPSFFFVGRLENVKGVDILIKAVSKVKKSVSNFHLYIAGSGDKENELKELVKKLDCQNNITFLGFISGDKKWSYYKSTDLFILPSRSEIFGIASLEAMACSKPIVASNIGGNPYVVEDGKTGLLFKCGDVDDLAEKIIFLLQNSELREKMGESGLEKVKEFSWDKIAASTLSLYREIFHNLNKSLE